MDVDAIIQALVDGGWINEDDMSQNDFDSLRDCIESAPNEQPSPVVPDQGIDLRELHHLPPAKPGGLEGGARATGEVEFPTGAETCYGENPLSHGPGYDSRMDE